jgi:Icc-related predicted phosphoesterase
MRMLVISDLHGHLESGRAVVEAVRPDALLSCGDWGDPDQVTLADLQWFSERVPVLTVYGNHDPLDALPDWRNRDGSLVTLVNGEVRGLGGLRIAGINGIWAKSHRQLYYVLDEEVAEAARRAAAEGPVDVLLSHGCPRGVADLTLGNRHGGQRCFLDAFETVRPRVYLTGHLHRAQEYRTRDGRLVRNVGETPRGDATLLTVDGTGGELRVEPVSW